MGDADNGHTEYGYDEGGGDDDGCVVVYGDCTFKSKITNINNW